MKILKKLTAAVLMATFMMTMGLTAFAAGGTKYNVGVTLYKHADRKGGVSKGNEGIKSVTAVDNADGETMDVTINTRDITVFGFTGTLTELRLFDGSDKYEGILSPDGYSFTVRDFPKELIEPGRVIRGEFKTDFAIMGTRTGYLRIDTVSQAR